MRRYRIGILATALVLAAMLPARVRAEEAGRIRMDEKGTVTLVSSQMAKDEVSTMSFSISVDAAKGESAEFLFAESNAKILEYRYNREEKKMDVYLAGTQTLFPAGSDSLTIGRIVVRDGNGAGIPATASVSAESLQYVYGTELKSVESMESSGAVQITGADTPAQTQTPSTPSPVPSPKPQNPPDTGNDDDDDDDDSQGPDNGGTAGNPATAGPQTTPKPVATKVPVVHVPQSTPKPSPTATPEVPAQTLKPEEDDIEQSVGAATQQPPESDESQEEEDGSEGKIDWVWVLAVGGIVIFAGVAVMAFVTLNRKPD